MMAFRLIASSFSPRLVVVLKAQVVPRRLRRPVLAHRSPAAKTYANDTLKRANYRRFLHFLGLKTLFCAL